MASAPRNGTPRESRRHRCPSVCVDDERAPLLFQNRTENDTHHSQMEQDNPGYNSVSTGTALGSPSEADSQRGQHCHPVQPIGAKHDSTAWRKLLLASVICLLLMTGEIIGGILANSLAIATDAAHLLTDLASFMISLFSLSLARRAPTKTMHFGWYRAEVMGALMSVLMIWVVTGILVYMAIQRVIHQDFEINATIMLITAACGVACNILMGLTLHQHGHSHGGHSHGGHSHDGHSHGGHSHDGHSHGGHSHGGHADSDHSPSHGLSESADTEASISGAGSDSDNAGGDAEALVPRSRSSAKSGHSHHKATNINVRAAFIHVIGDLFQSVGVLVAAYIIYYKPSWKLADPICTFVFSILVLLTTTSILKDTLSVLMEGAPKFISYREVKQSLQQIKGVRDVHNLRVWQLTVDKTALAVHLAVDLQINPHSQSVLGTASVMLREQYGIYECTIQMEEYVAEMDSCDDCQDPRD